MGPTASGAATADPAAATAADTAADTAALADAIRGFAGHTRLTAAARQAAEAGDDELPAAWPALAAQELLALPFDARLTETATAAEELGAALAPGPVVPTLLAAHLVRHHADPGVAARLEAGVRDGSCSAAVSINQQLVGGAAVALAVLPIAGEWYAVDAAGLALSSTPGIDPTRRVATVGADLAPAAGDLLGGVDDDVVLNHAAVLLAAEAVGIGRWCLDTAVDYAKVREQFGQPIGGFQAVKHRCADMLCDLEIARAAVWDATTALATDPTAADPGTGLAVAVAAALAPRAAVGLAKSLIQVLGGIGFTWEHDAHLYLKRALASRQLLGGAEPWHRRAVEAARRGVRRTHHFELGAAAEPVRDEARRFLATLDRADLKAQRIAIADAGYLVPHWPAPYGRDAGPVEQLVIDEEFAAAGVTRPDLVIGNWALPTILAHGTDEQRARFVPPTLHGDLTWCQMFSEPGAGSDLASLSTRAVRAAGGWRLSGQKVWTSGARTADWAICLGRTSTGAHKHSVTGAHKHSVTGAHKHSVTGAHKHDGITYFLVDMRSPGLDVRPLRELTGEALFNEIFLTDVFVPDDCVVGEVDGGWQLARTTLANERVSMSSGSAFPSGIEDLLTALAASDDPDDPVARDRVGELVCIALADAMLGVRATLARVSGTDPGAASSVRKLVGMHLRQDAAELALELLGPAATAVTDEASAAVLRRFLSTRALTIAGGTSEVLHNVIGERILGLPR